MAATWLSVLCFVLTATVALGATAPKILKVTTLLTEPFARYISLTALPHELEGYIPDLLREIERDPDVQHANIKFNMTPVEDGQYGTLVGTNWNGMIRKLKDQVSDMAAAPLTMNDRRMGVVTFLEPAFMTFDLAMLMRKRDVSRDVQSFDDLNKEGQTKYTCGVVDGGSTARYFGRSQYYILHAKLSTVENIEEGVRRVRDSTDRHPFIFIGEQQMLEYHASQKPCDLTVVYGKASEPVSGARRPAEYHLAVRKNYDPAVVDKMENALVRLNETGRLDQLYKKWWEDRSQCSRAPPSTVITSGTAILVPILFAVLSRLSGE